MAKVKSTPALREELLVICGRGGFHEQALLALLASKNVPAAEAYCVKYGIPRKGGSNYNGALLKLVELLFKHKDGDMAEYAHLLMARHAKALNGTAVLNLIPASTPLVKVMDFLSQLLPHSAHEVREKTLARNLSNIYNLQVQCERVDKYSESVEIDTKTTCGVCRKRIDTNIFAVYPNGSVVHFACGPNVNMHVDPISGEIFAASKASRRQLQHEIAHVDAAISESKDEDIDTVVPASVGGRLGLAADDRKMEKQKQSHFEKLNTLKLLLDIGHLTQDEYVESAEKLSFDPDSLEVHSVLHHDPLTMTHCAFSGTQATDVEMQAVCAHYAKLYNEHEPPLKVKYANSWLLKLRDRQDMVCSVEEYLPGAYVKYSNNNGYVGTATSSTVERERNTPQAFSHFTFVSSDYRLMVVDIQGVNDSYTDPQIHTADGRGFGIGNLGTRGMETFLQSHRWLGLRNLNEEQFKPGGTAAPLYRMPHEAIKKSTSRITEERNAFARSVTVSEVLGSATQLHTETSSLLLPTSSSSSRPLASFARSCLRLVCCCFDPPLP
ncbi:hypothetical protein DYB30_002931 [Aphanomyces astaci]|uniref:Alpha-type protein kinase domain-containing protein n=3 Tax=Aphanomyces astaci TaxID=112090 RepID=A0A397DK80_APHAT|nr:hypothetical protein DYB30_002931 [Aphanomyces astaci]